VLLALSHPTRATAAKTLVGPDKPDKRHFAFNGRSWRAPLVLLEAILFYGTCGSPAAEIHPS
jgi:hypothetical protein